jgi:hypothetical protein
LEEVRKLVKTILSEYAGVMEELLWLIRICKFVIKHDF